MNQIPVLLITGFLGSGKTTFINWLIRSLPTTKMSIILNEFGDVRLESQFIERKHAFVTELANGCMCCVAKSDIPHVIHLILDSSPHTEYIVIEASGLSDPEPIRIALKSPGIAERIYLSQTVCIVDTVNFEKTIKGYSIISAQLSDADLVLLSKIKAANKTLINKTKSILRTILPDTAVYEINDTLSTAHFIQHTCNSTSPSTLKKPDASVHTHIHTPVSELIYKSTDPLAFSKYQSFITHLPPGIVRAKGFVYMIDESGVKQKLLSQYVNGVHEFHIESWDKDTPHTAVLFLGKEFSKEKLYTRLDACKDSARITQDTSTLR